MFYLPYRSIIIRCLFCSHLIFSLIACSSAKPTTIFDQAKEVALAFNNNDALTLQTLIDSTLIVRDQEWESASDGSGFLLGAHVDSQILNSSGPSPALIRLANKIRLKNNEPQQESFYISDFTTELNGIENTWSELELVLFLRGVGDVEHIVLLGFDAQSKKLKALYIN